MRPLTAAPFNWSGVARTVSPSTRRTGRSSTTSSSAVSSSRWTCSPSATRVCFPPDAITAYIARTRYRAGRPGQPSRWRNGQPTSAVVQLLVDPGGLAGLVIAVREGWGVAGGESVEPGGAQEVAVLLVEVGGDRVVARHVLVDLGQRRQPGGRAVGLADRNRPVEPHDRRVGEAEELVVPLDDLDPVGLLDAP